MQKSVGVQQLVQVTVDEAKFTPKFMAEFRDSFYDFHTVDEHIVHLGQLYARGRAFEPGYADFIEGYGPAANMGIRFAISDPDAELVDL